MITTIPLRDTIPSEKFPFVNVAIIIINILVFFYELSLGRGTLSRFVADYGVVPASFFPFGISEGELFPRFLPLFTSMFLHGGWFHLGGNMLFLWVFGDNVENSMGHFRYLLFYLLVGLGASLTHIVTNLNSQIPTIGASGAIAGVLGAYFFLFPRARVVTLIPLFFFWEVVELPALFFLGFWFLLQFLNGVATIASQAGGGVAWWAHIGGFIAGLILVNLFRQRKMKEYL